MSPQDIVDRYHSLIKKSFEGLGISFDIYAVRVDKVGGSQRCAAGLALVAVCFGIVAVRAFACHIAVGKELALAD